MDKRMTNYLLGKLGEPERLRLEDQLFVDDELFAEMLAAEDRMFSDYLDGKLEPGENERFAEHILTSADRRRQLETYKAIRLSDANAPLPRFAQVAERDQHAGGIISRLFSGWGLAFAATCLAVISVTFWLAWPRQPEQSAVLQAPGVPSPTDADAALPPNDTISNETAANSIQPNKNEDHSNRNANLPPKPATARPTLATLILTSGSTRGGANGRAVLKLGPDVRTVVLKLSFDGRGYSVFDAMIQTPEGKNIWQSSDIRTARPTSSLLLNIPANSFSPEDYILTLSGREADGRSQKLEEYFFSVERP